MDKPLLIDRNAVLKSQDSPYQTYGCRHYNPNICKNNGMENICAFVRADTICLKPPISWTKQYKIIKMSKTIRVPKESNPAGWWPGAFTN